MRIPKGKPTYLALTKALFDAAACMEAAAAAAISPSRIRFRLIRCADKIRGILSRVAGTTS